MNISIMNWKRGLLRLWLLAAIPWVVYSVGEFDVVEKVGYARLYYTDRQGLIDELRSPVAVAECVSRSEAVVANRFIGSGRDLLERDLLERFRMVDAIARGEEFKYYKDGDWDDAWDVAFEANQRKEWERIKTYLEKSKAIKQEETAKCRSRTPEAPDLQWIFPVLVAPTFGVAFAAFAVWLAFLTIRWAWRGFYS